MRKVLVLLLALFLVMVVSCDSEEGIVDIPSAQQAEAEKAINQIGNPVSVVHLSSSSILGSKDIEESTLSFGEDEAEVESHYYLASFSSLNETLKSHLSTIEKSLLSKPANLSIPNGAGDYKFLLRFCYFEGSSDPAFRELYYLDPESDLTGDTLTVCKIAFSPDFRYDIDNQLDILTGEPKKYEWKTSNVTAADHFVVDDTDLSSFTDGINGQWLLVDPSGNPSTRQHVDATYILEVQKEKAAFFYEYRIGSFASDHLRIRNFTYENEDKDNMAYFIVEQYPENYRHDWSIRCYWYEDGRWNYSREVQTDGDLIPISYVDKTDELLPSFFEEVKSIGTVSRIFQAYKGDEVYDANGSEEFIVEFSDVHENLEQAIQNPKGKPISTKTSIAGELKDDTVAYCDLFHRNSDNSLRACIIIADSYTSYTYLSLGLVEGRLTINSQLLDHYDSESGKYIDISNYDGSIYFCEYDGDYDLEGTLARLGTVVKTVNYTGGTGQDKPYVQSFYDGAGTYVSVAAQFSSFDEDMIDYYAIETRPQNPYFTHGYQAYDLDYEDSGLFFAELDIFFKGNGELSSVQVRKITDLDALETGSENILAGTYATTYKMLPSFLWIDHYDSDAGKYRDVSDYDGSIYYSEYEGAYDLDATLAKLGTIDKFYYHIGETGQATPYITTMYGSDHTYVSVAAQFSSFNQSVLEDNSTSVSSTKTKFAIYHDTYDLDYDGEGLDYAELDVFFDSNGDLSEVQVRKITDLAALGGNTYATKYIMDPSFLEETE